MKIFIILFLFVFQHSSSAAVIYWDGEGGDGQWNTASNWSGNINPAVTDEVVLDNSIVSINYTVLLPAGNVTIVISSLNISPGVNNLIILVLPVSNTANPGFSVTGPSNALVLNNNALLKNSSGASAGSGISISNGFSINNGGHYIHNTNRGNAVIVSQLSTAVGTESGIFEFDVPVASYVLSLSNRSFGTLVLSSVANNGIVTYSGSGASPLTVRGDLQINNGVNFAISMSANFIIRSNYLQAGSSTFNLQTSTNNNLVQVKGNFSSQGIITESNSGLPVLELGGTVNQDINTANAMFNNSVDFRLNNPSGASLSGNLSLPYRLSILSGNLTLGNFNLVTALINQTGTPAQTTNHIVTNGTGCLKILSIGSVGVIFPLGPSTNSYNPVTVSNGGGADFSIRVDAGINPSVAFPTFAVNRTWNINTSIVTAGVGLKFQYASADANTGAAQPQPMEILLYSGNAWSILNGNTNIFPGGADPAWTVTSAFPITINNSASAYALGVNGGWSLPVRVPVLTGVPRVSVQRPVVSIYPQPIMRDGTILIQSPSKILIHFSLISINGTVIKRWDRKIAKGSTREVFYAEELRSGCYLLLAESEESRFILKLIKQ